LIALWVVSGLSFAGDLNWVFDNLTAFVVQYAALAACFALIFSLLKAPRRALFALVLAVAQGARLWEPSAEAVELREPTLKIVSANVHTSNREYERFLSFVRSESPDVVAVIEIDDGWAAALKALAKDYPHSVIEPRSDNFGIALLSRVPWRDANVVDLGDASVPSIVAHLDVDRDPVTIVATHPFPPIRSAVAAERNRQLAAVAEFTANQPGQVIVMGDLNISPWSPYLNELLRDGGLSDSRRGFDLQPSWPTFCPPLMTPIDHVLTTSGLAATDRRAGPPIGSDHMPVIATIGRRR
jgi:endonuclease/exonuclease/phosphatase (EEP) superfamily protein YafD